MSRPRIGLHAGDEVTVTIAEVIRTNLDANVSPSRTSVSGFSSGLIAAAGIGLTAFAQSL